MSLVDYFISDDKRRMIALEYIDTIETYDKSNKEKCKWMLEVSGSEIDDLDGEAREIPFNRSTFIKTKREAESLGKVEHAKGNSVEIWKLVKQFNCPTTPLLVLIK